MWRVIGDTVRLLIEFPSSKSDSWKLLEIDYQFHHLIAESSGNQWLLTLLEQVFDNQYHDNSIGYQARFYLWFGFEYTFEYTIEELGFFF